MKFKNADSYYNAAVQKIIFTCCESEIDEETGNYRAKQIESDEDNENQDIAERYVYKNGYDKDYFVKARHDALNDTVNITLNSMSSAMLLGHTIDFKFYDLIRFMISDQQTDYKDDSFEKDTEKILKGIRKKILKEANKKEENEEVNKGELN